MMRFFFLLTLPFFLLGADHRFSFGPEVYRWVHTQGEGTAYGGYVSYEYFAPWTIYTGIIGEIAESEDHLFYNGELRYGVTLDFRKRVGLIPYVAGGFLGRKFEDLIYYAIGTKWIFAMEATELGFDVRGMKVAADLNVLRSIQSGKWSFECAAHVRHYIASFFSIALVGLYREYAYDGRLRHLWKGSRSISVRAREYGARFELSLDF